MAIRAPFLPREALAEIADQFFTDYHPTKSIPVPIEEIVEFRFQIDIVPVPGLHGMIDVDSYPTSDLTEIHVDDFVYNHRENRYRFSFAHELAHVLVHQDVFNQLTFSTIDEWRLSVTSIPDDQYGWIEWQAYTLAGMLLVPTEHLQHEFSAAIALAEQAGVDRHTLYENVDLRRILQNELGKKFLVSRDVIEKCLNREGLWDDCKSQ